WRIAMHHFSRCGIVIVALVALSGRAPSESPPARGSCPGRKPKNGRLAFAKSCRGGVGRSPSGATTSSFSATSPCALRQFCPARRPAATPFGRGIPHYAPLRRTDEPGRIREAGCRERRRRSGKERDREVHQRIAVHNGWLLRHLRGTERTTRQISKVGAEA